MAIANHNRASDERGEIWGIEPLKRVGVELTECYQLISTQSIPNQLYAHPREEKAQEPIPHASRE